MPHSAPSFTRAAWVDPEAAFLHLFADAPHAFALADVAALDRFEVEAGLRIEVLRAVEFVQDTAVWGLFPHTHLRGKKWEYKLVLPTGEVRPILSVPERRLLTTFMRRVRRSKGWRMTYQSTIPSTQIA